MGTSRTAVDPEDRAPRRLRVAVLGALVAASLVGCGLIPGTGRAGKASVPAYEDPSGPIVPVDAVGGDPSTGRSSTTTTEESTVPTTTTTAPTFPTFIPAPIIKNRDNKVTKQPPTSEAPPMTIPWVPSGDQAAMCQAALEFAGTGYEFWTKTATLDGAGLQKLDVNVLRQRVLNLKAALDKLADNVSPDLADRANRIRNGFSAVVPLVNGAGEGSVLRALVLRLSTDYIDQVQALLITIDGICDPARRTK